MKAGSLLNVETHLNIVIAKSAAILELLPSKYQPLLLTGNTFLLLDPLLEAVDRIRLFYFDRNALPGEGGDEDLHATRQTFGQVQRRARKDVVEGKIMIIFELLDTVEEALLLPRNSFLGLDHLLDGPNPHRRLADHRDSLPREHRNEDLELAFGESCLGLLGRLLFLFLFLWTNSEVDVLLLLGQLFFDLSGCRLLCLRYNFDSKSKLRKINQCEQGKREEKTGPSQSAD